MTTLALHGFTGCGEDFAPFADILGGHWLCPDLPGHGAVAQADCSSDGMIDSVGRHAREVQATPRILLGYSMGARAALLHALEHPQCWDALILISGNPGIENVDDRAARCESDNALADRIETDGVETFLEYWQSQPLIQSQQNIRSEWLSVMQANRAALTSAGLAASLRGFGQGAYPNLWSQLPKLTMPTLCIAGDQDAKYSVIARRMQATLPDAQTAIISSAGHMPHLESPDETAAVIKQFLASALVV